MGENINKSPGTGSEELTPEELESVSGGIMPTTKKYYRCESCKTIYRMTQQEYLRSGKVCASCTGTLKQYNYISETAEKTGGRLA